MKHKIDCILTTLLLCMLLAVPQSVQAKKLDVTWKNGLLSVDAEDVDAVEVLKKIEEATSIHIEVGEGINRRIKTFKAREKNFKVLLDKMLGGEGFGMVIEHKGEKIQKVKVVKKKGESSLEFKDVSSKDTEVKKEIAGHIATLERLKRPKNEKEQEEVFSSIKKIINAGKIGLHLLKAYFKDKTKDSMIRSVIGELMLFDEVKDDTVVESMAETLNDKDENPMVRGRSGFYMGLFSEIVSSAKKGDPVFRELGGPVITKTLGHVGLIDGWGEQKDTFGNYYYDYWVVHSAGAGEPISEIDGQFEIGTKIGPANASAATALLSTPMNRWAWILSLTTP